MKDSHTLIFTYSHTLIFTYSHTVNNTIIQWHDKLIESILIENTLDNPKECQDGADCGHRVEFLMVSKYAD